MKKYNVLVIGSKGMLGCMVTNILKREKEINVETTSRNGVIGHYNFDIKNGIKTLDKILIGSKKFDYIINCTGVLNNQIDARSIVSIENAILVNSLFPNQLSILSKKHDIRVIHISTDAVFSPEMDTCYENMFPNCIDYYGITKKLGEPNSENFLNIRCSIIGHSPLNKSGLLEWFLGKPKHSSIHGFSNQCWNGVSTIQFSELCIKIILGNQFDKLMNESHTHHFCPNQSITKLKLLQLFKKYFRNDIEIKPIDDPNNKVSRLLGTNYQTIGQIYYHNNEMENVIIGISEEMKRNGYI